MEIELTNLQVRVAGKGATYRVVLRRSAGLSQSEDLVWEEGHDWGQLVREMKARREAQG